MMVTLQALANEHIPLITQACGDWRELAQFGPPYWRPRSPAELARKIAASAGPAVASEYHFVIVDGGRLVGECSLHAIDWRNRCAQVGVCIWRIDERGNGLGRDAVQQLVEWAEGYLDMVRLEAWILADNKPSAHLFRSFDFVEEGVLRSRYLDNGIRRDMTVLARVRSSAR